MGDLRDIILVPGPGYCQGMHLRSGEKNRDRHRGHPLINPVKDDACTGGSRRNHKISIRINQI